MYAVDLKETTCFVIFNTVRLLENYALIVQNLNVFATLHSLFAFLEKVIVYNWKASLSAQLAAGGAPRLREGAVRAGADLRRQ